MESIIEDLYTGQIAPKYSKVEQTEEFLFHRKEYLELGAKLRASFDEETTKLFEKYLEHSEQLIYIENQRLFRDGFVIGGKITAEIFGTEVQKRT